MRLPLFSSYLGSSCKLNSLNGVLLLELGIDARLNPNCANIKNFLALILSDNRKDLFSERNLLLQRQREEDFARALI